MSNEITTEVLAKAIDDTKDRVKEIRIGEEFKLEINQRKESFQLINKAASTQSSQLNAMAIAPLDDQGNLTITTSLSCTLVPIPLGMKVKKALKQLEQLL